MSVGSKALEHGKNCDVDVLLVHAPKAEKEFVEAGFGLIAAWVMYNDFVIIGPAADPAGIKGKPVAESLKLISEKQAVFVSRGDDSGTHKAEQGLEEGRSGRSDKQPWYVQAGQGMMQTIQIAQERRRLHADRSRHLLKYENAAKGQGPAWSALNEGDKALLNQYGVILVNPAKCPNVKKDLTLKFMDWIVSDAGQKAIAAFTMEGKQLFFPNAKK